MSVHGVPLRRGPSELSLLQEVEFFVQRGEKDITLGVPFLPVHLPRMLRLKRDFPGATVRILLDNADSLRLLENAVEAESATKEALCPIPTFLKVDCGYHRAGVDPSATPKVALELAKAISSSPSTSLFGLYAHSGNAYNTNDGRDGAKLVADAEGSCISAFADTLVQAGFSVQAVSVGSTPSSMAVASLPKQVTEMHPGNFFFFDLQQVDSGACSSDNIAVAVLSRVIGVYPARNEILLDAGGTAVHKDPGGVQGWGSVEGHPDLQLLRMSQECTVVGVRPGGGAGGAPLADRFSVGDLVRIAPNHSCMTACQHARYHVLRRHTDDSVADTWTPCKYW